MATFENVAKSRRAAVRQARTVGCARCFEWTSRLAVEEGRHETG